MSHTKGNWHLGVTYHNTLAIPVKTKYPTGNVATVAIACCKDIDEHRDPDEAIANARLIAAAPDLLEACKMVVSVGKTMRSVKNTPFFRQCMAAIAKAEQ
jgi:hypothetical protein